MRSTPSVYSPHVTDTLHIHLLNHCIRGERPGQIWSRQQQIWAVRNPHKGRCTLPDELFMSCECCGLNTVKCKSSLQGKQSNISLLSVRTPFKFKSKYTLFTWVRIRHHAATRSASVGLACAPPHGCICIELHTDQQAEASGERSPNFTHHFLHEHRRRLPGASSKRRYKPPPVPRTGALMRSGSGVRRATQL